MIIQRVGRPLTALLPDSLQEIKAAGGEASAINLDVSKGRDTIAEGIANAAAVYGHIDILVSVQFRWNLRSFFECII